MKIQQNVPKFIYVLSFLFAMAFWLVFDTTRMDNFAKTLYFFFLPLTATPYIMCVIHKEGQEPEEYLKKTYGGHVGLMWFVRIFIWYDLENKAGESRERAYAESRGEFLLDIENYDIKNFVNHGEYVFWINKDGELRETKNIYAYGNIVLGHKTIEHKISYRLGEI